MLGKFLPRGLPIGDVIFYGIVTTVFMGTSAFGAFEGWFGSGLSGFDGPPRPSRSGYVALAALYGSLCGLGCSTPFFLVLLALGLGSISKRRITTIWIAGNVSACLVAVMMMFLTLFVSGEDGQFISFIVPLAVVAAVPPGLQGLRIIIYIARNE